ncbi:MAG TPA: hypothetical protein VHB69_08415 [Mycobacteriales bacterium]|nr:hypothetical protein [Mycobacteriales bacterium]
MTPTTCAGSGRMVGVMGYAAHLRVYEPLSGLPEPERSRWQAYIAAGDVPSRPVQMVREHEVALAAVLAIPPRLNLTDGSDHAYVREMDGLTYVCPWRLQMRAWDAMDSFRSQLPDELRDAFFPAALSAAAEDARDVWRASNPQVKAGILTETWQVPVSWFLAFEASERRLVLGERRTDASPDGGLDRALIYLTAMSRARRRIAKALRVVRRIFGEGPATASIEAVGRWLEEFHPHSLVELDYGGLVHLVNDEALSEDVSVADLAEAMDRLVEGDLAAAGQCYERVISRWRAIASLEHAN